LVTGFLAAATAQAQQATITGHVTDQNTKQPLVGARVQALGSNYFGITSQTGQYTIRGINPGTYTLRVIMLGYGSITKPATVTQGQATTVDWVLAQVPYTLEEIVTTATGEQRKRELGNSIGSIDAPQLVAASQTPDLSTVLNGRVAGVTVIQNDGVAGSGSRIRIRGISSASLANDPLLYVDGVRVANGGASQSLSVFAGGGSPSFFNDINPEEIESIEVVKGPSASTLYGTQAANGVIRITTKRGKAGPPRWNLYTEQGLVHDPSNYNDVWFSKDAGGAGQCFPFQQALGDCQIQGLYHKNLMRDEPYTPLKDAYRYQYGAQVNGGTDAARYFVSAEFEDQDGIFKMPQSERDFLHLPSQRGPDAVIPKTQLEPNHLRRISLRSNVSANLSSKADVSLSLGYVNNDNLIPQTGDNLEGLLGAALYGTADPDEADNPWGFARPAYGLANTTYRKSNHFVNSGTVNFRPTSWLSTRGTIGLDYIGYEDQQLERNGQVCPFCGNPEGDRTLNRFQGYKYSGDLAATGTFKLTSKIGSKTSIGAQYNRDNTTASFNFGQVLPPGGETFTGAANKTSSEQTRRFVTLGTYVEQQFSWEDRLFVTGAVRIDQNSAFGIDSRSATYPKLGVSWVALEPKDRGFLSSLRLRGSFGASGQQPGPLDAIQYYTGTINALFGGNKAGVSLGDLNAATFLTSGLGNRVLRPERSKEIEAGFDAQLFSNRMSIEATIYRKNTTDALVQRLLAGSLGSVASRTDNVGKVRNEGIEISLLGRIIDKPTFGWDVQLELSGNKNRLLELGEGVPPITGFGFQQRVGYPLFGGWWPSMKSWGDADGNGIITPDEIEVTDTATYNGPSIPTRTASLNTNISLFRNKLRIGGQVEYKGGWTSLEVSTLFQCDFIQNCRALADPSMPLFDQARALSGVFGDFTEDGSFVRLREANVSWTLPTKWGRLIGATNAVATLTGRNLLHWLPHFDGWDSEISTQAGVAGDGPNYNFVQPGQPRYVTFRLQLTY
jgi:TonB-linked SusC/RagA family outer membrane protein